MNKLKLRRKRPMKPHESLMRQRKLRNTVRCLLPPQWPALRLGMVIELLCGLELGTQLGIGLPLAVSVINGEVFTQVDPQCIHTTRMHTCRIISEIWIESCHDMDCLLLVLDVTLVTERSHI